MSEDEFSRTTREDGFYNDVVRSHVLSTMEESSSVASIQGRAEWWLLLGGTTKESRYESREHLRVGVTAESFSDVHDVLVLEDEEELAAVVSEGAEEDVRLYTGTVGVETAGVSYDTFVEIELPDGSSEWMRTSHQSSGASHVTARLSRAKARDASVTVTPVSEGYEVTVGGETTTMEPCSSDAVVDTERHRLLRGLFRSSSSSRQPMAMGTIAPLLDNGEEAAVDVRISGEDTVRFVFPQPDASDSPLWRVVEAVGADGEPLSIEGESIKVSHLLIQPLDRFETRQAYEFEREDAMVINDDGWVLHGSPSSEDDGWFSLF